MVQAVPIRVPKMYNSTPEDAKKLFVDCFKTEVFSFPFLGSYSTADLFTDECLNQEEENDCSYITPVTLGKLRTAVHESFVTSTTILGHLILIVLQNLKIPLDLWSSEFADIPISNTSKTRKVPTSGFIWDQAPSRMIAVIHRIFLEYMTRTQGDVAKATGLISHDNFTKQKSHLLQVKTYIRVLIHVFIFFIPIYASNTYIYVSL
jgi:hypothetical protein